MGTKHPEVEDNRLNVRDVTVVIVPVCHGRATNLAVAAAWIAWRGRFPGAPSGESVEAAPMMDELPVKLSVRRSPSRWIRAEIGRSGRDDRAVSGHRASAGCVARNRRGDAARGGGPRAGRARR